MVKIEGLIGQNITVAYDSLNLASVDTSKLRNLGDNSIRPTIMETPEMIVAVLPSYPMIVQIGERRIRYTIPNAIDSVPRNVLPEILSKSIRSITPRQSKIIAYGFNYDLSISITEKTAFELLNEKFVPDQEHIKNKEVISC